MKWLLDTDVCIDVLRGRHEVVKRFRARMPEDFVLSVVTEFELIQGAGRAPVEYRVAERTKVGLFLGRLKVVPFDSECARLAGEINAGLLNDGTPVGIMDVFIAATALRLGVPVVTGNMRDFSRIKGLALLDWREA